MTRIPDIVLDKLPDPVLLIGSDRTVLHANLAAREAFKTELLGRDLTLSLRHPAILEAVDAVLAGKDSQSAEVTIPSPMSRTFEMHVSAVDPSLWDSASESEGPGPSAILMLHDMTTAVRAEQMRADFVANASHELRSPLAAILGFIETLEGPASGDAQAREKFLRIMHREAVRMRRLIDDLLTLSRVEINEHVRPEDFIDLESVVRSAIDVLHDRARERKMTLELNVGDGLPPIRGDADQLVQVVRNLVENAINYGRRETPVEVSLRLDDGPQKYVDIRIADHGEGIPEQHIPRLTERFYRADPSRTRDSDSESTSTGLGLAIVKHIVSRHRGRLQVESVPGEGSTFTVHLPLN